MARNCIEPKKFSLLVARPLESLCLKTQGEAEVLKPIEAVSHH